MVNQVSIVSTNFGWKVPPLGRRTPLTFKKFSLSLDVK